MGQKKNILSEYYTCPMTEVIINLEHQILEEIIQCNKKIDRIELQVCSSRSFKTHEKEFYTTEEVMEMLSISRRTLLSFRNAGKIGCTKTGNTVRFTKENIDSFKNQS